MTEEVLVSLRSVQVVSGEKSEPIEMVSNGSYKRLSSEKQVVQYEEVDEEDQEITKVTLVFAPGHVEIMKNGQSNVQLIFDKEEKTTSCYQTPYGELMVGINTTAMNIHETDSAIEIAMEYDLDMNYSHVAACNICVRIVSKETEEEL